MTISAIETRYAGCRFRSRLEARWAVFLDRLGVRWEYEPQGYLVGQGRRPYLPDFWLPTEHLWVEVKGDSAALDLGLVCDAVIPHWGGLPASPPEAEVTDASRAGRRLLLLGPIPRSHGRPAHSCLGFWKGDVYREWAEFTALGVTNLQRHDTELVGNDSGDLHDLHPDLLTPAYLSGQAAPWILDAYAAARSARFEHGEHG